MQLLTVSQVARELGMSVDWLRKAERLGRIPQAKRTINGWRAYSEADLATLRDLLTPKVSGAQP